MATSCNQKPKYRAWGTKYIQVLNIYTNTWIFSMELINKKTRDSYLNYLQGNNYVKHQ